MKKNKKLLIIAGALLAIGLLVLVLEKTNVINLYQNKTTPAIGPTQEEKQAVAEINADTKKNLIEVKAPDVDSKPDNTPANTTIELSAQQEANNSVTAFTKLPGYSSGSCKLTTTNGTRTNEQTANVIYQPEFSSCAGFSIPINELGKGLWNLNLSVTSNGNTQSKTISYEVK